MRKGVAKLESSTKKEINAIEKAGTSYPEGALSEMLKEAGRKTGEHIFYEDARWSAGESSKELRARLGKTAKNISSRFLGLFK
ncbi:MAG: hypothetical protein QXM75_00640 [Candidatus Diapherotrites archaeon]